MAAPAAPLGPGSGRPLAAQHRSHRRREMLSAIATSLLVTTLVAVTTTILQAGNLELGVIIGAAAGLLVAQHQASRRTQLAATRGDS